MQILILLLSLAGIFVTQALIGGARLIYAIPGYLIIAAAGLFAFLQSSRKKLTSPHLLALLSTLLLVGYVVSRSLHAPVEYLARADRLMVLAAFIIYLVTANCLTNSKHRMWLLAGLFGFSALHFAAGVLQFARNDNFMLLSLIPAGSPIPAIFRGADYGWRASGFYVCPNHLAGLFETLALIALAWCLFGRTRALGRMLILYFGLSALAGVALSGSRGGYISTAAGFGVMMLISIWVLKKLHSRRVWLTFAAVAVVACVLIAAGLVAMSQSDYIQSRIDQLADTKNMRLLMWQAALKQFQLSPFLGTGSGTYLYFGRKFRSADVQNDPQHVHNDYLELLCEYGVLGGVLFALFFTIHLFYGFRALFGIVSLRLRPSKRIISNELALLIGTLSALAALTVHSILDFNCHVPGNVLFYAFLFGILASPTSDVSISKENYRFARNFARYLTPVISVILAFMAAPLLRGEYHNEWARVHLRNQIHLKVILRTQTQTAWAVPFITTGVMPLATGFEMQWFERYLSERLLPRSIEHARAGLKSELHNPDLYYHLGEALSLLAEATPPGRERNGLIAQAGDAYAEGVKIFPQDSRLQWKLAYACDRVGLFDLAESHYLKALECDPNLGNLYASYGYHLWLRRKLVRAEAYYRRALDLDPGNQLARAGLSDIARVRAQAMDRRFVEEFGDPLDIFDTEPPTAQDEARGVYLPEAEE